MIGVQTIVIMYSLEHMLSPLALDPIRKNVQNIRDSKILMKSI